MVLPCKVGKSDKENEVNDSVEKESIFFFRVIVILVFIDSNSNIYEDILICSRSVITILDNPERSLRSLFRYMIKHHYCGWRKTRWKEVT